ncbi:hypothetical protein PUNSTDRAFT_144636 [Punctularia strigosozonata HHB-11173 SS5]|uniref:uncharacterized protein n=1 Tax=Punctularia strigosozonata (strain HHB-11173) TaxID=741275 RepID=UPI0004416B63|nr:uncharacterized protein PUNSTDRAFT_144636 [Punctularia strigosozonata HHB-11173 SS5]EIN07075.1 hypothetical protein PUNSTDRAFT_144636 [Punctularia strigosozonata HHB-11173 SS5]
MSSSNGLDDDKNKHLGTTTRLEAISLSELTYASKGWTACARAVKQYDESLVAGWKEEIDSLLVFAGLFSAVLTAFAAESYQMLSTDPAETSAAILQQINVQLRDLVTHADPPGSAATSFSPATVTHSAIRINTLWFSSLACSLSAALFGMMEKQWIREYTNFGMASPRESLRMRQYRYEGLMKWGVFEIVGALPVLLQVAVILFLIGLVDLLWNLHPIVAGIFTVLTAITLLMAVAMAFMPVFSSSCPYKSPLSFFLIRLLTPLSLVLRHWGKFFLIGIPRYFARRRQRATSRSLRSAFKFLYDFSRATMSRSPVSWSARDLHPVRLADDLEHVALAWAHKSIVDDDLLDAITPCIRDLPEAERVRLAFDVVAQKSSCDIDQVLSYIRRNDVALLRTSTPARCGPIWDEVHYNDLALLALPERAYHPTGVEREVVRQLRMLLDVLTSCQQLPSFVDPTLSTRQISRRDIISLIDSLLEYMPPAGQIICRDYCTGMLSLTGDNLYSDVRLKAMVMRSLYTFARTRDIKVDLDAVHNLCDTVARAFVFCDSVPPKWDTNHREMFISASSFALRAFAVAPKRSSLESAPYLRLLNAIQNFVASGAAGGWSSRQWCENLYALAEYDDRLVPATLVQTIYEADRQGHLRILGTEREYLIRLHRKYCESFPDV